MEKGECESLSKKQLLCQKPFQHDHKVKNSRNSLCWLAVIQGSHVEIHKGIHQQGRTAAELDIDAENNDLEGVMVIGWFWSFICQKYHF